MANVYLAHTSPDGSFWTIKFGSSKKRDLIRWTMKLNPRRRIDDLMFTRLRGSFAFDITKDIRQTIELIWSAERRAHDCPTPKL